MSNVVQTVTTCWMCEKEEKREGVHEALPISWRTLCIEASHEWGTPAEIDGALCNECALHVLSMLRNEHNIWSQR